MMMTNKAKKLSTRVLKKYDIIYYPARQPGGDVKNRPFLVLNKNDLGLKLLPFTHTSNENKKSPYNRYNIQASKAVTKLINSVTGQKDDSYFKTSQIINISHREFEKNFQQPKRLGNMRSSLPPTEIENLLNELKSKKEQIAQDYMRYQKLTKDKSLKSLRQNPETKKTLLTECLSRHQLKELQTAAEIGVKPFKDRQFYPAKNRKMANQYNKKQYKRKPTNKQQNRNLEFD